MQFVNEEWAKTWQQEYRALLEGADRRGSKLAVAVPALCLFAFFLFALWGLRRFPLQTNGMFQGGLLWALVYSLLFLGRNQRPPFAPLLAARLRAVTCHALLLMGLALALELAFFAVALSAGLQLTVPLQTLASRNPELAWPAVVEPGALVFAPTALGHAFGVVPFACMGLCTRLGGHKPKPGWVAAIAPTAVSVLVGAFAFVAEEAFVATYRSPLAAVAVGLLVIAAYALLVALLGRQWEVPASAKAAEPAEA